MRVTAAGTRLQLSRTGTAFTQAACRTPKSSPERPVVGREKSFSPGWVGRGGRMGRKRLCLSDGEHGAKQSGIHPWRGQRMPTQCHEHPAGEKAMTGAPQAAA